jgi:hypothetical protein
MACSFLKEGKKNKRIKQIIAQPRVLVKELTYWDSAINPERLIRRRQR